MSFTLFGSILNVFYMLFPSCKFLSILLGLQRENVLEVILVNNLYKYHPSFIRIIDKKDYFYEYT